jgi:hypothetical protein
MWEGLLFVILWLKNSIFPSFGFKKPVIKLNKVVFPDPFGPITPNISPSLREKDNFWMTINPPKDFETFSIFKKDSAGSNTYTPFTYPNFLHLLLSIFPTIVNEKEDHFLDLCGFLSDLDHADLSIALLFRFPLVTLRPSNGWVFLLD